MEVIFCQVSTKLIQPDNPCLEYYRKVYPQHEGYHIASEHFMEIPTWIAVIAGKLGTTYDRRLHVIENIQASIEWLCAQDESAVVLFSVLDVNKRFVNEIAEAIPQKVIAGGYVHPGTISDKIHWFDSVDDMLETFPGRQPWASPDYSLFEGMKTIPRISLSDGCLYNCSFCTIDRELTEYTYEQVASQAMSYKGLDFELVYVNDKTFGQAKNWKWIATLYDVIHEYNPEFKGFIVQTTVPMANRYAQVWADDYLVKYIEVGVEVVDNEYLRRMHKPYSVKQLKALMDTLDQVDVGFIPNIIFGLPDDDYRKTLHWLWWEQDRVSFINPYVLCQYDSSKDKLVEGGGEHDTDENTLVKSWLSLEDVKRTEFAMRYAFYLTGGD